MFIGFLALHWILLQNQKPAGFCAGGLWVLRSLWPFSSGHGSPPAWMTHDGGGDRDGGCSASV
jgi:hypothetical protein